MKYRNRWLTAALFLAWVGGAAAEESVQPATTQEAQAPAGTQAWLELQRSGQAASAQRQPLSGPVMEKMYERYVKSFGQPIPAQFQHTEGFTTGR